MVKYYFREDEPRTFQGGDKADAQKIGEALAAISDRSDGYLVPHAIVEEARDKKSVLHQHFEWKDDIAAQKYRMDQARAMIRCINVASPSTESGVIRAFVSIREKSGVAYRTMADVLNSADLQSKVLAAAERDLLAFENRYKNLSDVCELIKAAREKIVERRKTEEGRITAR